MNKLPAQKVNGLIDGIEVLQELAMAGEATSGKAIADKLGLNSVRVNRLLKTLDYLGLAHRDSSRRYSIGSAMHILAAQSMAASGLLARALPQLQKLSKLDKVVALGVLWKDQVCYLYHNNNPEDFNAGLTRVKLYPALESSIGVALLAELDEIQLKLTLGERYTEKVKKMLQKVSKNGFTALKHHDHISLAMPIGKPAYAALAISNIKNKDEQEKFQKILEQAVIEINNKG
jgi:DNA-binding IclR family transcriptional regulator